MHRQTYTSRPAWILLLLGWVFALGACSSDMTVGNFMVSPSGKMVYTDTCTVHLTTQIVDSLVTTNTGIVYCGTYDDPYLGTTSAVGYTCFNLTTFASSSPISTGVTYPVIFDSLILSLQPARRFYGDTLQDMTIHIHQLKELIEDNEDIYGYCYNTSSIPYEETPVVSYTFRPHPRRTKPVEIRLPDAMGEDLLEKIRNSADEMTTTEKFRRYFKGFALVPDENDHAVLGYHAVDTMFFMQLYYHTIMEYRTDYTITFPIHPGYQFNQYQFDRTGTPTEGLVDSETDLFSYTTGHKAFVQGLAGMYSKIEFPYLNDIEKTGKLSAIVNAELRLYPAREAASDETPLPSRITLYISDEENPVIAEGETVTGTLVKDQYERNTHYAIGISSFIAEELGAIGVYKRHLQLVLPDTSLYRIVLGDHKYPDVQNQAQLNIQYMVYDPHE
ncbi:MAG: DUF4270 domain-containing protein [Bacteroidales bacterium]|nr:DUF4270 domain-containing protein [Bacteroidales bacterium]